jgi:DNA adenine methylase
MGSMRTSLANNQNKVLPFLKWAGGKRWFTSAASDLFPTEYNRYIEPFLGSAAVFFHLSPKQAILSDLNPDLINIYQVIRDSWQDLEDILKHHHKKHSKEYYYQVRAEKYKNKIKQAAQFLYLNRTCWNGLYRVNLKGEFNVPIGTKTSVLLNTDNFEKISQLLQKIELECCDFENTINSARRDDFLFIDPPYTIKHNNNGFIKYNESIFSWKDQERLRDSIFSASTRGVKILMTNAYHDSIKELYQGFGEQIKLDRASIISGKSSARGRYEEIVVRNWS